MTRSRVYTMQVGWFESIRGHARIHFMQVASCKSRKASETRKTRVESSSGLTLKGVATSVTRLAWSVYTRIPASGLARATLNRVLAAWRTSTSDKSGIRRGGQIVHNLYLRKKARYLNIWGCMGPRACLDASVKREIPLSGIEPWSSSS
jgi:hypothetical protein